MTDEKRKCPSIEEHPKYAHKPLYYVLKDKRPVAVSMEEFATSRDIERKWRVGGTYVGKIFISTIFLGLDCSWGPPGSRPILFETMVFGGPLDQDMVRYSTWEEAEAGHLEMVEKCRRARRWTFSLSTMIGKWLTAWRGIWKRLGWSRRSA